MIMNGGGGVDDECRWKSLAVLQSANIYIALYQCSTHTDHWALAAVYSTSSALKLNWTPVADESTCTR